MLYLISQVTMKIIGDFVFLIISKKLKKGKYKAVIDSSFKNGNLEFGVKKIPGSTKKEFLISSYLCHPSMANNELSGPLVMLGIYDYLKSLRIENIIIFFNQS